MHTRLTADDLTQAARDAGLSPPEVEVLALISFGFTDRMMGHALHISHFTANDHVDKARLKLGARTRAHAVAVALRAGIIV